MPHKDPVARLAYQREYQEQWRKDNPEKWAEIQRAHGQKRYGTPVRVAQSSGTRRRAHMRQKLEVLTRYGDKCAFCPEKRVEVLTIDHINGDGKGHRKEFYGKYRNMYDFLARTETRRDLYRILCANCHQALSSYGISPDGYTYKSRKQWIAWSTKRRGGRR